MNNYLQLHEQPTYIQYQMAKETESDNKILLSSKKKEEYLTNYLISVNNLFDSEELFQKKCYHEYHNYCGCLKSEVIKKSNSTIKEKVLSIFNIIQNEFIPQIKKHKIKKADDIFFLFESNNSNNSNTQTKTDSKNSYSNFFIETIIKN